MRSTGPAPHDGLPVWAVPLASRRTRRPLVWSALGWFSLCALLSFVALRGERRAPAENSVGARPAAATLAPLIALPDVAAAPQPVEPAPALSGRAEPAHGPTLNVVTGRVQRGSTLSGALERDRVPNGLIYGISRSIRPLFDFRHSQPGDFYSLIRDEAGELLSFEYHRGRRTIFRVVPREGVLAASVHEAPLERRVVQLAGLVDRSLSEALRSLGEGSDLVREFADLFVWDLDFSRETRPGDEFRLVVEKLYDREGFVQYGRILAGEYRNKSRDFVALYFEDDEGYGSYFTPEGNSLRRSFLRAPVSYTRISSRYSKSRLHPILKVRRPHEGVDYAAPVGTPVWAVADGEVIFIGRSGGFGRLIKVRHNNGYVSYYGHLSRYAKSLKVSQRVRQKQVIGFVGSTGLATGPHLDYRLRIGGRYVDPLKVQFPKGDPIPEREREHFQQVKARRLTELRRATPSIVLEAGM